MDTCWGFPHSVVCAVSLVCNYHREIGNPVNSRDYPSGLQRWGKQYLLNPRLDLDHATLPDSILRSRPIVIYPSSGALGRLIELYKAHRDSIFLMNSGHAMSAGKERWEVRWGLGRESDLDYSNSGQNMPETESPSVLNNKLASNS